MAPNAVVRVLEVVCDLVFLGVLAAVGGIINHMRGEDGGMLAGTAFSGSCNFCFGYWLDHIYDRAVMALPTGALLSFLTRKTLMSMTNTLVMFASIFVGWGCYMGLGWQPNFNTRSGAFDWLLGRELEGWEFGRRWVRDAGGMGLRGLVWTVPAGYHLYRHGYGWEFLVCGSLMPLVYTLGFRPVSAWHSPDFVLLPGQDWAFSTTTPMSEFIWGTILWLVLISAIAARPHARPFTRTEVWVEVLVALHTAVFLASTIFYSTVSQHDFDNYQQTLWGMALSTLALLVMQLQTLLRLARNPTLIGADHSDEGDEDRDDSTTLLRVEKAPRTSRSLTGYEPPSPLDRAPDLDAPSSDDYFSSLSSSAATAGPWTRRARRFGRAIWASRLLQPYGAVVNVMGVLGLLGLAAVWIISVVSLAWNWDSPRYCTWQTSPDCMAKA